MSGFLIAFVVIMTVALSAATVVMWLHWRSTQRELRTLSERLGASEGTVRPGTDVVFEYLERAAEDAHTLAVDTQLERDQLRGSLDASTDGVVIVDFDGTVVFRNGAGERFHDARHSDALAEDAIGELLDRARRGEVAERELQLFGPPRQVLFVRAIPLRDGRDIIGATAFVRDVSEARRVESMRRDFAANVSHELKTPIGALALLAETMGGADDIVLMKQLADRVLREADRLGRIIDDLLDLSLIEAQESPTREPVPVNVLIVEAVEQVWPVAHAAEIPILVAESPVDVPVPCDRRQVLSALTNLLDNAVKYSEPGQPVEVSATTEADKVVIAVRDQGVGIPSRDLERIFERFYRVDRARSRATGGTGLGLAIVRHVAQAHGGDVTVESREGEGSTFRLRLATSSTRERPFAALFPEDAS